jgi:NitT/TauT family transport system ATP-binding protein
LLEIAVEEPKTIIFVTHDIEEAIYMGDRVIVMSPRPGRVSADIEVSFERTPSLEMRASSEFQNLRLKISSLLRDGE